MNCQIHCWGILKRNSVNKKFLDELNLKNVIKNTCYFYSPNILITFGEISSPSPQGPINCQTWILHSMAPGPVGILHPSATRVGPCGYLTQLGPIPSMDRLIYHFSTKEYKYRIIKGHLLPPEESPPQNEAKIQEKVETREEIGVSLTSFEHWNAADLKVHLLVL